MSRIPGDDDGCGHRRRLLTFFAPAALSSSSSVSSSVFSAMFFLFPSFASAEKSIVTCSPHKVLKEVGMHKKGEETVFSAHRQDLCVHSQQSQPGGKRHVHEASVVDEIIYSFATWCCMWPLELTLFVAPLSIIDFGYPQNP